MSDRWAVAVAVAVALGAWRHPAVSLALGVALVGAAFAIQRPVVLVLGGFVLAAALGTRAHDGLAPIPPASFDGTVTLIADPTVGPYGTTVDVRVGRHHVQLEASDGAAGAVSAALAGERMRVRGHLGPPPPDAPWLVPRHVVGRLRVQTAERVGGGAAPWRAANRFRRLLDRGAEAMPPDDRALYGGFVLGDDRDQSPAVIDDFRGAGLSHLLVVSGQNVAFLLVVASPFTRRLGLGGRWAVTVGLIAGFGVLTRFEPSVLRASAMATLAVTAALAGRPVGTVRILALAVAGLVLVDPLLVESVGFQLSVAASAGIGLLGPPIVAHLPGPRWWREAIGVTVAAQLGVAPVLVPRFGGLPVVSVPANVVSVPVAGLVTTWGLPAGVVAGLGGPAVAGLVHLPTSLMIGWVAAVARVSASLPLGDLGAWHLVALVLAGVVLVAVAPRRPTWHLLRHLAVAVIAVVLVQPAVALHRPPPVVVLADGARLERSGGSTVLQLQGRPQPGDLMEALRRAGVRRIDVVMSPGPPSPDLLAALRHRWPVGRVITSR